MKNRSLALGLKRFVVVAANVTYWSFAATMILAGASAALFLVSCFVFPFLPLLLFFPLISALGSVPQGAPATRTGAEPRTSGARVGTLARAAS